MIIWGVIFAVLVAVLLAAGGMGSLRSAMIIGALPFSLVMALDDNVAMVKALVLDSKEDLGGYKKTGSGLAPIRF